MPILDIYGNRLELFILEGQELDLCVVVCQVDSDVLDISFDFCEFIPLC